MDFLRLYQSELQGLQDFKEGGFCETQSFILLTVIENYVEPPLTSPEGERRGYSNGTFME